MFSLLLRLIYAVVVAEISFAHLGWMGAYSNYAYGYWTIHLIICISVIILRVFVWLNNNDVVNLTGYLKFPSSQKGMVCSIILFA